MHRPLLLLLSAAALPLLLVGCDALGGEEDTVVLTTTEDDTQLDPVTYEFRYTQDDVENNGQRVEVASENSDNLGTMLSRNGFDRSDVVSAQVDSVTLRRQSSPTLSGVRPKVFDYLSGAAVFLGTDAGGTQIADDQFDTTRQEIPLRVATSNVTAEVKEGSTQAFLQLTASGSIPQEDVVDAAVYYRIEVSGV